MEKFLPCLSLATLRTLQNYWTKNSESETELKIVQSEIQIPAKQEFQEKSQVQRPVIYMKASDVWNLFFSDTFMHAAEGTALLKQFV